MSTDHQQYSTENQHDAIQRFADAKGMTIVRSFIDAGKSGVGIQGRDALQDLLRTVERRLLTGETHAALSDRPGIKHGPKFWS